MRLFNKQPAREVPLPPHKAIMPAFSTPQLHTHPHTILEVKPSNVMYCACSGLTDGSVFTGMTLMIFINRFGFIFPFKVGIME